MSSSIKVRQVFTVIIKKRKFLIDILRIELRFAFCSKLSHLYLLQSL